MLDSLKDMFADVAGTPTKFDAITASADNGMTSVSGTYTGVSGQMKTYMRLQAEVSMGLPNAPDLS